jgi:hypothetical protein
MYTCALVPLNGSTLAEDILPLTERVSHGFNIRVHLLSVIPQDAVAAIRAIGPDPSNGQYRIRKPIYGGSERVRKSIGPAHVTMVVTIRQGGGCHRAGIGERASNAYYPVQP